MIPLICILLSMPVPQAGQAPQREFASGYTGTLPINPKDLARTYFNEPAALRLLFEMENGPLSVERTKEALSQTHVALADLLRLKLLRIHDGRVFIDFNYFNAADMKAIDRAGAVYVPSLVRGYLEHQQEFDRIFRSYSAATVSPNKMAFVLIAGFSLNWDGLATTARLGYRKPILIEGKGWHYSFWATELVPGRSTKGYYWGSSTFPGGGYNFPEHPADYAFSSFGDPYSDPRMSFPDLFATPSVDMAPAVRDIAHKIGLIHETSFGMDIPNVLGLERTHDMAAILFRLRAGPETEARLAAAIRDPDRIGPFLALLEEIQYIERGVDGRYHLIVPVLDREDKDLVDRCLALSRRIFSGWLETNYAGMRKDLGTLTATKHGVPFESLFTQIWHEWFGLTTRELVDAGFMFDPYGKNAKYKGSFPALWRTSLYRFKIE